MSVAPFEFENFTQLERLNDPAAKVIVAPSLALLIAVCTSEEDAPAGHDHVWPLPLHDACAGIDHRIQISPARQAIRRIIICVIPSRSRIQVLIGVAVCWQTRQETHQTD
jgi:hypothetical protein